MIKDVLTVDAESPVSAAAKLIKDHNIGAVIVLEENKMVGILSERDLANRVIAASEQTKKDIIRFLHVDEDRIKVVYQGCHRQFYSRVSQELMQNTRQRFGLPAEYLLYVGTIEERKNLLKIVQAMNDGNIDSPLVVVGRKTGYFNHIK